MRTLLTTLILSIIVLPAFSQGGGVSINSSGAAPDPSAMLDVSSTTGGILIPRMSTAERNAISSPADGLQIYNLSTDCIQIYMPLRGWSNVFCDCSTLPIASFTYTPDPDITESIVFAADDAGLAAYSWSFASATPATASVDSPTVVWSTAGSYSVSLTTTNDEGCTATNTQSIDIGGCPVYPVSTFTYSPAAPATGVPATFAPDEPGHTYSWTFSGGSPVTSSSANPAVSWSSPGTYDVTLIATNSFGCSDTTTTAVTVVTCITGGSITFNYTGAMETWVVPAGVCEINVDIRGGAGGDNTNYSIPGGDGARVEATLDVTAGETLYMFAGGQGVTNPYASGAGSPTGTAGGWNGGGQGGDGAGSGHRAGSGGGGASDIRAGGTSTTDRIIVAGGGGGSASYTPTEGYGGDGGLIGESGVPSSSSATGGTGGTATAAGTGGSAGSSSTPGLDGVGAIGGAGGNGESSIGHGGGGGGGGYFGGGGGGGTPNGLTGGGGGGGSSYVEPTRLMGSPTYTTGYNTADGQIIITW